MKSPNISTAIAQASAIQVVLFRPLLGAVPLFGLVPLALGGVLPSAGVGAPSAADIAGGSPFVGAVVSFGGNSVIDLL